MLPTVNDVEIPVKKADLAIVIHNSKSATGIIYDGIRKKNPTMKLSQMNDVSVPHMALPPCVEVENLKSFIPKHQFNLEYGAVLDYSNLRSCDSSKAE